MTDFGYLIKDASGSMVVEDRILSRKRGGGKIDTGSAKDKGAIRDNSCTTLVTEYGYEIHCHGTACQLAADWYCANRR
jgi:hypothetical protein